MQARSLDAAEGYRIYRRHSGDITRDEINEALRGMGLREVSRRTVTHYGRLASHGFDSYVPINRFDIAVAGDVGWSEELRAGYAEHDADTPATLTTRGHTQPVSVRSLGAATASVLTTSDITIGAVAILKLSTTGITRICQIVRYDPAIRLGHIAFDLFDGVPVAPPDSEHRATFTFEIQERSESLVAVSDTIHKLNRTIAAADTDREHVARVERIGLASPLEIIVVGGGAISFVALVFNRVAAARRTWYEGTKAKYEGEGIAIDNAQKKRIVQLEADTELKRRIEAERNATGPTPTLDSFCPDNTRTGGPESDERDRLATTALRAIELPSTATATQGNRIETDATSDEPEATDNQE